MMVINKAIEVRVLKAILWVYIILCLVIAGLNYGYAGRASPEIADLINSVWHFYENWIKTIFIVIGAILTFRIVRPGRSIMRRKNLIGLFIAALVIHIIGPILLKNPELYFFAMPLPWTTTPIQLLDTQSSFYVSRFPVLGVAGIISSLTVYVCVTVIVLVGTILFGRRWQCSTLCMFNGFAAEVFAPVFPLLGKRKMVSSGKLKAFSLVRWLFLGIALFFTIWWTSHLIGVPIAGNMELLSKIENYKYLGFELMVMMFFWIVFAGRGYCYYCPLGTVLSVLGRISGQCIITDNTDCIQCGQCNSACPLAIDVKGQAESGQPVKNLRCVGCGHCVDICPTHTLSYSTRFLSMKKIPAIFRVMK